MPLAMQPATQTRQPPIWAYGRKLTRACATNCGTRRWPHFLRQRTTDDHRPPTPGAVTGAGGFLSRRRDRRLHITRVDRHFFGHGSRQPRYLMGVARDDVGSIVAGLVYERLTLGFGHVRRQIDDAAV